MEKGKIIILNGVSSSGKTTIAKGLQNHFEEHYFWVANDSFCDMCSSKHWKQDWVIAINKALTAMIYSIKAFSNIGLNVIVDQVFLSDDNQKQILEECVKVLHDYPVFFIRVDCELNELERRERERGNRRIGQAKSQLDLVHNHGEYDLSVNTSEEELKNIISKIEEIVTKNINNNAFQKLYEKLQIKKTIFD